MRGRKLILLIVVALFVGPPAAHASGSPDISLTKQAPSNVLFGSDSSVTLTASNPARQPAGYNLSFRDVLPAGVSYVAGSAPIEPEIITDAPGPGETTLIWENVSDLSPGSSYALGYQVRHSTSAFTIGDTYTNQAGAYINADPRFVPKFAADGTPIGPQADSYTGYADSSARTEISAIEIEKSEPSPEGELLRGVHNHPTVYSLTVRNNSVRPTDALIVDDYLPAGLEYLECGKEDHTTDAPTNPGSAEEYDGSGSLGAAAVPAAPDCVGPDLVETVMVDPDGAGGLAFGVYTHVRWSALGTLPAGGSQRIQYVAAVPIRENTTSWTSTFPPTPESTDQGSNLDNNSGAETQDEQELSNYARADGLYDGTLAVSDDHTIARSAEDLAVHKGVSDGAINQGDIETWTLDLETSEYRYVDDIRVTDTLPDGLCPLDATDLEAAPQSGECAPTRDVPSSPYTSVNENADGTYTIFWDSSTVRELTRMQPSSTFTISFPTRTRANYQEGFEDERPVLTRDSWQNDVSILGADFTRCAPFDPDCTGGGKSIDHDERDGEDDADVSSAGQEAAGVAIDKRVRETVPTPIDCATGNYVDGPPPLYGPGDRICWQVRVDFAALLDSGSPRVTDFLPPNTAYEPGSAAPTRANTVRSTFDDSSPGVLSWDLGSSVDSGAQVFEWRFATIVDKTSSTQSGDIEGNLMKFSYSNSAGTTFPLRDQADFEREEAELSLLKGVRDVNGAPGAGNPPNTDGAEVEGGDVVTYRVDVANNGERNAEGVEVWDVLPSGISCADISAISNGGTCDSTANRIVWSGLTAAAGATRTLTYDLTIPSAVSPSRTFINQAGVRTYTSESNIGTSFRYIPEDNIDPNVSSTLGDPNAVAAGDGSDVFTAGVALAKSRSTELSEPGNSGPDQATIGEEIEYRVTTTIPAGTTLYGRPVFSDPLGSRQTYVPRSASATLNGAALPAGFTLTDTGNEVRVQFDGSYTNRAGSGDDELVVSFRAQVDDESANNRLTGSTLDNTATFSWEDQDQAARDVSDSVDTTLVEPALGLAKNEDDPDNRVAPGQTIRYTVTASNSSGTRVSTAHNLELIDTLPAGVTPVIAGGLVSPDGGTWDAAARTITWNIASLTPGASAARRYDVQVDAPQNAGAVFNNNAVLTGTSLPDPQDDEGERTAGSPYNTGYRAAAGDTVSLVDATVSKAVTPGSATIGDELKYTVDVTLPADIRFFDTTVIDNLPDGTDYDSTLSITCVSGCPPAITGTDLPEQPNSDGSTRLGWFLGDIDAAPAERVVRIVYSAHVDDLYEPEATAVSSGQTLSNSVRARYNGSDQITGTPGSTPPNGSFTNSSNEPSKTVTVTEPQLALDKTVSGDLDGDDRRTTQPGDSYTYTVTVTNTGDAPAYDVEVGDQPDAEITNVVATDGAGLVTDGWSAGDPDLRWTIPGPIAPGGTVTLRYTADLIGSASLEEADEAENTADVTRYFGVPAAERSANRFDYREYDGPADTVTLEVNLPRIAVEKTAGAPGNPESSDAEIGQAFTWRVVVRNDSPSAGAEDVDLSDVLPRNWSYVAGSASFTPGVPAEPVVTPGAGGDTLDWSDVADLGPGQQIVLTFQARPSLASATDPGSGPGNPHVNTASASAQDTGRAGGSADGPYSDSDGAQAVLVVPALGIVKTPDGRAATAGDTARFEVEINNPGAGTARNVEVTDLLPAGVTYTPGAASAAPGAGFSEASVSSGPGPGQTTVVWRIASIRAGGSVTITVPVTLAAELDPGTTLVNDASVVSDEQPSPQSDQGSFEVETEANLSVTKSSPQSSVTAGELLDYVLRAENDGPSEARAVVVSDALPTNVDFVSAEAPCTAASGTVTCALGTLAPGASRELDLRVRVRSGATGNVVNEATVSSNTPETDASDNSDGETTPIGSSADLRVEKSTAAPAFVQGDQITYDIVVTNDGPSDAAAVTLTDNVPAGTSYVSATSDRGSCSHSAGVVTCAIGALPNAAVSNIELVVNADAAGTITNSAAVSSPTPDPDTANNDDDAGVTVAPAADLEIEKTGDATVAAGGQASYSLNVTNNGPSNATGVTVVDTLPAGTSFVSSDPTGACSAAGAQVTCTVGALNNGDSRTIDLVVQVPFALGDQQLTNTAVVSGDQADTDSSNDSSSAQTTVGPAADLELDKSAGAATSGGEVTYTLAVSNRGPSTATGVRVQDTLPEGLSLRSATPSQGSCSSAGASVDCALGAIAAGAAAQITIVAAVADLPAGTRISNSADVSGDQPDPEPGDNSDSADVTVQPRPPAGPDVSMVKRAGTDRPQLGKPFVYTLSVRNAGPGHASNVRVTDTLSADVRFVSARASQGRCQRDGRAIRCSLGDLEAGSEASVRLRVVPVRPGKLVNTASVTQDEGDLDVSDNLDTATGRVRAPRAGYRLSKQADRAQVLGGELVRFQIVVRMKSRAGSGVRVCDRLPDGLVFVRAPGATFRGGRACWRRAYVAPGATMRMRVVTRAERGFSVRRVYNTVVVSGENMARGRARARVVITPLFGGLPGGVTG